MAKQLWAKGDSIITEMHRLTVGEDPVIDLNIVTHDCVGSAAHARMLAKIGILTTAECRKLLSELKRISSDSLAGKFRIPAELEDAHTAIENRLTAKLGEAGKKIHTGRSRNDQVILAVRLYLRKNLLSLLSSTLEVAGAALLRAEDSGHLPMPGFTHFQPAMPSSTGMWLHSIAEGLLHTARCGFSLFENMDSNPLGSAAGFGSGLPLKRDFTAKLLGFSRVQRSFIDIQNSRGRQEEEFLFWCCQTSSVLEKFAFDVVLGCSEQFGFFKLPADLTTGSSIMPQKRNPDLAELLRARASVVRAAFQEVSQIRAKLPSSYHRDFQLTKPPLFRGALTLKYCTDSAALLIRKLNFNEDRLQAAMTPDLFATYEAYRLVQSGIPFREAYKTTAEKVKNGGINPRQLSTFYKRVISEVSEMTAQAAIELKVLQSSVAKLHDRIKKLESDIFTM